MSTAFALLPLFSSTAPEIRSNAAHRRPPPLRLGTLNVASSSRRSYCHSHRRSGFKSDAVVRVLCQVKLEDDVDDETCELVNGVELVLGEGQDSIRAYLLKAVKNNNGTGILLLSDIFGFENSSTRDFAYRVACNGYNINEFVNIYHQYKKVLARSSLPMQSDGASIRRRKKQELPWYHEHYRSELYHIPVTSCVLVPDLFRGDPSKKGWPQSEFEHWLPRQLPSRVAKDIETSTKWLIDEFTAAGISKKFGIIGFCFGGGKLIEALARDQQTNFGTGICFYGTRVDTSLAKDIKVPVLFICGDNDHLCPISTLQEMEKNVRGSRVVIYSGRGHGFAHQPQSQEEDADAEDAFAVMRSWLHDCLVSGKSQAS